MKRIWQWLGDGFDNLGCAVHDFSYKIFEVADRCYDRAALSNVIDLETGGE